MLNSVLYIGLACLAVVLVVDGMIGYWKTTTVSSFFLMDGRLKWGGFVGTIAAANFSLGNMIFLSMIWGAFYGLGGVIWITIGFVLAGLVYTLAMKSGRLKNYIEDKKNSGSLSDFLATGYRGEGGTESRWSERIRLLSSITVIVTLLLALALELYLAAYILSPILGIETIWIFSFLLAVIGVYSSAGGYWSVVSTDFIQGFLLILSFCILGFLVVDFSIPLPSYTQGYGSGILGTLGSPGWVGIASILSVTFGWFLVTMDTWQRASATRSARTSVVGLWIGVGILVIGVLILGLLGMYDKLALSSILGDRFSGGLNPLGDMYMLVDSLSTIGVIGFGVVVLAFVMAGVSTVDTFLIAGGHSLTSDILIGFRTKRTLGELSAEENKKLVKLGRKSILYMVALVLVCYLFLKSVGLFIDPITSFFVVYSLQFALLIPLVFILGKKRLVSAKVAFWSIIAGLAIGVTWGFGWLAVRTLGAEEVLGIAVQDLIFLTPAPIIFSSLMIFLFPFLHTRRLHLSIVGKTQA